MPSGKIETSEGAATLDREAILANGSAVADGNYSEAKIKVLEGIEASAPPRHVHRRHHVRGLHHLVYEIVDNSIDEAWPGTARTSR